MAIGRTANTPCRAVYRKAIRPRMIKGVSNTSLLHIVLSSYSNIQETNMSKQKYGKWQQYSHLAIAIAVTIIATQACSWDSSVYDTFVNDTDQPAVKCPDSDSGSLAYIKLAASAICTPTECTGCTEDQTESCKTYQEKGAFKYNLCPKNFPQCTIDVESKAYCYAFTGCQAGQLDCGGVCVSPSAGNLQSCEGKTLTCKENYNDCDGIIENGCESYSNSDDNNCGACNVQCDTTGTNHSGTKYTCLAGVCEINICENKALPDMCIAPDGSTVCVNVSSNDKQNCGQCNAICENIHVTNATSNSCTDGKCQYNCIEGYQNCGTGNTIDTIQCIKNSDFESDSNNCGRCGNKCDTGFACVNGTCKVNSCSGETPDLCVIDGENTCLDLHSNDADHCGNCNTKCSETPRSNATSDTCEAGKCIYTCEESFKNCGTDNTIDFVNCIDITSDRNNCGDCEHICSTGQSCVNGTCECPEGQTLCYGKCMDLSSLNIEQCSSDEETGEWSKTCVAGYDDCDQKIDNGCEINVTSDSANCGSCANICLGGQYCSESTCICPEVAPDFCSDGNGSYLCVDSNIKNEYCGCTHESKGVDCTTLVATEGTMSYNCVNKECKLTNCNADETQCGDACINLFSTDITNCGKCGLACDTLAPPNAKTALCDTGVCHFICNEGYYNKCLLTAETNEAKQNCQLSTNIECVKIGTNTCCGDSCVNCEAQNTAGANYSCHEGTCQITSCDEGQQLCSGVCRSTNTDQSNCGICGNICGNSTQCTAGNCVCTDQSKTNCGSDSEPNCRDTDNDTAYCGNCTTNCETVKPMNSVVDTCSSGVCQFKCETGYYNKGGSQASNINCVKMKTNTCCTENCIDCTDSSVFTDGFYTCSANNQCEKSSCEKGYTLCTVNNVDTCIDLSKDNDNCGVCNNACQEGTTCKNGRCECSDSNLINCGTAENPSCIHVKSTDINNCGGCGIKCEDQKIANTDVDSCNEGVCYFKCNSGYTNKGSETAKITDINCIANGSNTCCGDNCADCTSISSTLSYCDSENNKCACLEGYYLNNNSCIKNDNNNCGQVGYTCTGSTPYCKEGTNTCIECIQNSDCTITNGYGACSSDNKCAYFCKDGYELSGNQCNKINGKCTTVADCEIENSKSGSIACSINNECLVYACIADFEPDAPQKACIQCGNNAVSPDGIKCTECADNTHKYGNICEENTVNNCGSHDHKCSIENGQAKCVNKTCALDSCDNGYHAVNNTACEEDTDAHCGSHENDCSSYTISNSTEIHCINATCQATKCETNYIVQNGQCAPIACDTGEYVGTKRCLNEHTLITCQNSNNQGQWSYETCVQECAQDACTNITNYCTSNDSCTGSQKCEEKQCKDLTCADDEVAQYHTCIKLNCASDEVAQNHQCKALTCSANQIAQNHQCTECAGNEIAENNQCKTLTCNANEIAQNHQCTECAGNEVVENNQCKQIECDPGLIPQNHTCITDPSQGISE